LVSLLPNKRLDISLRTNGLIGSNDVSSED